MKPSIAAAAVLILTIGSAEAARKPRPEPFEQPFAIAMQVGDPDQLIVEEGSLQAIVRCEAAGTSTRLRMFVRSSVDGLATTYAGIDLPAGDYTFGLATNDVPEFASGPGVGFIALSPDGSFIAFGRDTFAGGVNVLGSDCIAVGIVTSFTAPL